MPTLSSSDLRPVHQRPRGGLSARFYFVVLIAAVLMIVLQAIPLLHGRGAANADATGTQQNPPAATETTQSASEQPAPAQSAAKSAQPAATLEPQAKLEPIAPTKPPAADTPITSASPASKVKPETTPPPAPPGDTPVAATVSADTAESTPAGFGVTVSVSPDPSSPVESANAPVSSEPNAAFAFFSSVQPNNLVPAQPTNHEREPVRPAPEQPQPDMWRGVLRLLSALTKINFTAPADAPEPEAPLADAAAPVAIPEDVNESSAESSPSDVEPAPLSSAETLPAATQPVSPADDESRLVIENPLESGGMIRFLVDGNVASLRPGENLTLRAGPTRIQFHRGDEFENVDVEVSFGAYQFRPTKTGWTLSR
jgi:hypothetical protein